MKAAEWCHFFNEKKTGLGYTVYAIGFLMRNFEQALITMRRPIEPATMHLHAKFYSYTEMLYIIYIKFSF
jgi:hypothetical protein